IRIYKDPYRFVEMHNIIDGLLGVSQDSAICIHFNNHEVSFRLTSVFQSEINIPCCTWIDFAFNFHDHYPLLGERVCQEKKSERNEQYFFHTLPPNPPI